MSHLRTAAAANSPPPPLPLSHPGPILGIVMATCHKQLLLWLHVLCHPPITCAHLNM